MLWPNYPEGLLDLWPSMRYHIALLLQRKASLGDMREDLKETLAKVNSYIEHFSSVSLEPTCDSQSIAFTRSIVNDLANGLTLDLVRGLTQASELDLNRAVVLDMDRAIDFDLNPPFHLDLSHPVHLDLARALIYDRNRARACDRALRNHNFESLTIFNPHNTLSITRAITLIYDTDIVDVFNNNHRLRSALCLFVPSVCTTTSDETLPLMLMIAATRHFLPTLRNPREFLSVVEQAKRAGIDPFWLAFANHVAGRSTLEDRALLEDLAANPTKRSGSLSWALQHTVRGDILLADDTVVTLDELCIEAGVPLYPLLEDMPSDEEMSKIAV